MADIKRMNRSLIVADLDDTLLRRDKSVSDYTVSVFEHLRECGMLTAFATARPKRAVYSYIDILDKMTFDSMVFHNGAVLRCGEAFTANFGIPSETARTIAIACADIGLSVGVEINDINYANYDPIGEWPGMQYVVTNFKDLPNAAADKIIVRKPTKGDIEQLRGMVPNDLYFEMNEGILGLIMHRDAAKWNALQLIAEHFNINTSAIVAFGDDLNDIEMLRKCGVGVAVANAIDECKAAADYVCGDCDDDGVAKWLEENLF
jgi:Cof subfamily protein (haloacid dehalogenase superfamily)